MSENTFKMKHNDLHKFIKTIALYDDYFSKKKYISKTRALLREFAIKILKLSKEDFKISVNEGGQMVSADVCLRTNSFEIYLCPEMEEGKVLYRSFDPENKSKTGCNNWLSFEDAFDRRIDYFITCLERLKK